MLVNSSESDYILQTAPGDGNEWENPNIRTRIQNLSSVTLIEYIINTNSRFKYFYFISPRVGCRVEGNVSELTGSGM